MFKATEIFTMSSAQLKNVEKTLHLEMVKAEKTGTRSFKSEQAKETLKLVRSLKYAAN